MFFFCFVLWLACLYDIYLLVFDCDRIMCDYHHHDCSLYVCFFSSSSLSSSNVCKCNNTIPFTFVDFNDTIRCVCVYSSHPEFLSIFDVVVVVVVFCHTYCVAIILLPFNSFCFVLFVVFALSFLIFAAQILSTQSNWYTNNNKKLIVWNFFHHKLQVPKITKSSKICDCSHSREPGGEKNFIIEPFDWNLLHNWTWNDDLLILTVN